MAKEVELKSEAKVLGAKRVLQQSERQAMLKAVEQAYGSLPEAETPSADYLATKMEECEANEPTAATLDEITSKRDARSTAIQSAVDSSGVLRITKLRSKGKAPATTEEYRRIMRVECNAWLCTASRFKAKSWLHGLKADDFDRFVRYILGDRVNLLEVPNPWSPQNTTIKPPWNIVLAFEHKLRREAMKKVNHDGETLAAALEAVTKDSDLKESYFTTPLALQAGEAPPWSKWQRLEYKGKGKEHKGDWKGDGKAGWKGHTKNKDGKPTHKGKYGKLGHLDLVSHTPDGREICYAFNAQGCKGSCGRLHVCRVRGCYASSHGAREHDVAAKTANKDD